jgi:hypothetical protein
LSATASARGAGRVPDKGVLGTYRRLQRPQLGEGFDWLYYVEINEADEFIVKEWHDEVR